MLCRFGQGKVKGDRSAGGNQVGSKTPCREQRVWVGRFPPLSMRLPYRSLQTKGEGTQAFKNENHDEAACLVLSCRASLCFTFGGRDGESERQKCNPATPKYLTSHSGRRSTVVPSLPKLTATFCRAQLRPNRSHHPPPPLPKAHPKVIPTKFDRLIRLTARPHNSASPDSRVTWHVSLTGRWYGIGMFPECRG